MEKKSLSKKVIIGSIICSLVLLGVIGSYAYFMGNLGTNKQEEVNVQTGNLALIFADGNDAITESLEFGGSIEKTFSIENTGTLDAYAKINWEELVNIYLDGSLTYTLSASDTIDGTYTNIVEKQNVPRSEAPDTVELANGLEIPVGKKYYYKLTITLNYLESTDQTEDLNAMLSTHFKLEEGTQMFTVSFIDSEKITEKRVLKGATYGELPVPTKAGYIFLGWYTAEVGGEQITAETLVNLESNQTLYTHWTTSTEQLIKKANASTVSSYNSGNMGEMYAFTHPATSQTPALTDYRYIGNQPNNYIKFNSEVWRIIGEFSVQNEAGEYEKRIKIIRNTSIGSLPWNSNDSNNWAGGSLATLLNSGNYYNRIGSYSSIGLTEEAKKQIESAKFYLGGATKYGSVDGSSFYSAERSTQVYTGGQKTSVFQNVGIMYASDLVYTYALGVSPVCYSQGDYCYSSAGGVPNGSWLFNSGVYQWTMTPFVGEPNYAFMQYIDGGIGGEYDDCGLVTKSFVIRPTVYLRSNVELIKGDGTSSKPYEIKVS